MSYLLANGCSFTASNYGSNSPSYHTEKEKNELGIPLVDWPMWPEYVSTKLGLSHINLGASGGSNTRMVTSTIEQACREKPYIIDENNFSSEEWIKDLLIKKKVPNTLSNKPNP